MTGFHVWTVIIYNIEGAYREIVGEARFKESMKK
jgi:hypothetical protein